MTADLKRFRQSVRRQVRLHVQEHREAPPLTCWVSRGPDPRKVAGVRVGAAVDSNDVRARIVEAIREAGASYAAIGRLLHVSDEGELHPTSVFGLVVCSRGLIESFEVDVVAGRMGAWRYLPAVTDGEAESMADTWFFVLQAIRGAS